MDGGIEIRKTIFRPEGIYKLSKDWTDLKIEKPVKSVPGRIDGDEMKIKLEMARKRA